MKLINCQEFDADWLSFGRAGPPKKALLVQFHVAGVKTTTLQRLLILIMV
jgi:hypothetical protein